jgi:GNAT superfamily N-acetyltransferase
MAALPSLQNNKDKNMSSTLRVLGCSGGISAELRTTSFLLDQDVLIDAGTGVGDLTLDELKNIHQVFVTHSHLDHICSIPFMADAVGAARLASKSPPLQIYGIPETLDALKKHLFNDVIWPDFSVLPTKDHPTIMFHDLEKEKEDILIGAFEEDEIMACCILTKIADGTCKLRQMAVRPKLQGTGLGAAMMNYAEQLAKDAGYKKMVMNARKTAKGFYEKLGYEIEGDEFVEVTLPHFYMQKNII